MVNCPDVDVRPGQVLVNELHEVEAVADRLHDETVSYVELDGVGNQRDQRFDPIAQIVLYRPAAMEAPAGK